MVPNISPGGSDEGDVTELHWKAEEILLAVDGRGGTAEIGEVRESTGIESLNSLNHHIKRTLVPRGFLETMIPESEDGRSVGKVLSIQDRGERLAEIIRDQRDVGPEDAYLSLGERMEKIESAQSSPLGSWDHDKKKEYELLTDLARYMRDFILKKHGDEFKQFLREHDLNDNSE